MIGKHKFIDYVLKPYVLSDHEERPSAPYQFLYFVGKILSVRLWVSQKTWGKKYLAEYFHSVWAGIHDWRVGWFVLAYIESLNVILENVIWSAGW